MSMFIPPGDAGVQFAKRYRAEQIAAADRSRRAAEVRAHMRTQREDHQRSRRQTSIYTSLRSVVTAFRVGSARAAQ